VEIAARRERDDFEAFKAHEKRLKRLLRDGKQRDRYNRAKGDY
jgi:hypothetical protein